MAEPLLDEDDFNILNEALQAIADNEENLTRAEQAGLDVSSLRDRIQASREQVQRIKASFFPGR